MNAPTAQLDSAASNEFKDSLVICRTNQGIEIRATLIRLTRYTAVCEIYNPDLALHNSEAFTNFKIVFQKRTVYSGRAVVQSLVDAGISTVCELKLDESSWLNVEPGSAALQNGQLSAEFKHFMDEWQKLYKVTPEFKLAVGDMQSFLSDMRLWLEQVDLNVRLESAGDSVEREVLQGLHSAALPNLALLFERFEYAASKIEKDLQPVHSIYVKRQLHPLVLCAPFMYRTFQKPLGYAGDYEMVNMMVRDPFQGASLFARILNAFFLSTPPVVAHRNRIDYLVEMLQLNVGRIARQGRVAKILNLGCGPAHEVQRFLRNTHLADRAEFTLLDFNSETIGHTQAVLEEEKKKYERTTVLKFQKRSVQQIIKESSRMMERLAGESYDLIYCAGLFDYLTDPVCKKLTNVFFNSVTPGGVVVVTNVYSGHPSQGWMEYVVDWHLFYRDSRGMAAIIPDTASPESIRLITEPSGVNIMLEIQKL